METNEVALAPVESAKDLSPVNEKVYTPKRTVEVRLQVEDGTDLIGLLQAVQELANSKSVKLNSFNIYNW